MFLIAWTRCTMGLTKFDLVPSPYPKKDFEKNAEKCLSVVCFSAPAWGPLTLETD